MKILTFKRLIGLTAIGGVAYVHRQRGGDWTAASIKDTLRYLWSSAIRKLDPIKDAARDTLDRAATLSETGVRAGGMSEDRMSRAYGDYTKRKDDTGRH
jgi:hypothetical protein